MCFVHIDSEHMTLVRIKQLQKKIEMNEYSIKNKGWTKVTIIIIIVYGVVLYESSQLFVISTTYTQYTVKHGTKGQQMDKIK